VSSDFIDTNILPMQVIEIENINISFEELVWVYYL
jgi:hypothetical protein